MKRSQTPPTLSLAFGTFYFFLAGLPRLVNEGRPYFKFMKHVDLDLPLVWLLWGAEVLGLYHPVIIRGVDGVGVDGFLTQELQSVALVTLVYMVMGYVLGMIITRTNR